MADWLGGKDGLGQDCYGGSLMEPKEIELLRERLDSVEEELVRLRQIAKQNRSELDINSLATIAFISLFGVAVLFLLSLKGRIGDLELNPLESLRTLAELLAMPAIGSAVAAIAAYLMKKSNRF